RVAGAGARVALGDLDVLRLPRRRQDRRGGGRSGAHAPPGVPRRHRDRDRPVLAPERRVPARAAARADRGVEPGRRGRGYRDRRGPGRCRRRRARAARRPRVAQRQHLRHAAGVVRLGARGPGPRRAGAREWRRDALVAMLLVGAVAGALAATGTFEKLLGLAIAEVLVIDGLTVAALFPLRAREPRAPFSVPGYPAVPILFIGVYLVLFIWTALGQSQSVLVTLAVLA